jgi:hypothetical protein
MIDDDTDEFKSQHKKFVIFKKNNKKSKGVTKAIKKIFFPSFVYKNLRGKTVSNVGGLSYKKARNRGKLLDTQLSKLKGDKTLLSIPKRALDETKLFIEFLKARDVYVESSQFKVANSEWNICTDIDIILRSNDENNDFRIIVEMKCGCLHRRKEIPLKKSQNLLNNVSVCALHLHQMQVLLGKKMFERNLSQKTEPIVMLKDCMLIYIDLQNGIECIEEKDFKVKFTEKVDLTLQKNSNRLASGKPRKQKFKNKSQKSTKKK